MCVFLRNGKGQKHLLQTVYYFILEIIGTADRSDIAPHVKDGYLMMFIYMPAVFGAQFTPYIGQIIVPILKVTTQFLSFHRKVYFYHTSFALHFP